MQSRMVLCGIFFALTPAVLAPMALATPKSSELHGGHWVDIENPTTAPAADPELLRIEQIIRDGKSKEAMKETIVWLKRNRDSPLFDRGLFLEAEALYQYGNRIKAFFYLDELLDTYPDSPLYSQALEKQYQIADDFLNGYKRRFLYIPLLGSEEEAVEMMYRLQQRSPGSPLAEKALLRTADYYYSDRQYDLAVDAYQAYIKNYPRSPHIPRVKLRQAYANLAQFHGVRFDTTPITDAKTLLEEIVKSYPELAEQENIPALLKRIDQTFAQKLAVTADFYRRTHETAAAVYTYEYLEQTYPGTPEAIDAERSVAKIGVKSPMPMP